MPILPPFDSPGGPAQLDDEYYYPGTLGFVPFPKPAMGKWELRDSYVTLFSADQAPPKVIVIHSA